MKKLGAILVLTILTSALMSQTTVGAKFGLNLSTLNGELGFKSGSSDNKFEMDGFSRGAYGLEVTHLLNDNFRAKVNLFYNYRGAEFEAPNPNEIREYYLEYIDLDLLMDIGVFSDLLSYYGTFGLYTGFLAGGTGKLSGNVAYEKTEMPITEFFEETDKQPYNGVDAGLVFGAGGSLTLGPGAWFVELKYGLGLTNVTEDSENYIFKSLGKNRVFSMLTGYRIAF